MQIIGGPSHNPAIGPSVFSTGSATAGGVVILHNMSPYDLLLTFGGDATRQAIIHAWQPRKFDFCGILTVNIGYSIYFSPPLQVIQAAPSSYLYGESFMPGEPIPESLPNYDRVSSIGNTVQTMTSQQVIPAPLVNAPFAYSGFSYSLSGQVFIINSGLAFLYNGNQAYVSVQTSQWTFTVPSTPSTTFYVYVAPDGTLLFDSQAGFNTNPPPANSLKIYLIQTNASGVAVNPTLEANTIVEPYANMMGYIFYQVPLDIAKFNQIGPEFAAGVVGVSVVVAGGSGLVTTNVAQNPVLLETFNTGFHRISGSVLVRNSVNGNNITVSADVTLLSVVYTKFMTLVKDDGTKIVANGANSVPNGLYTIEPFSSQIDGGSIVSFHYTDPTNVPNDEVYGTLERLF